MRGTWQTQEPTSRRGDLTQGPIAKTLLAFALPTLASSILQSLNGTVNAIWVGRFLGEGALAATSNANMVMFLLTAFVFGFGMASTILIGQAWGRKDVDGARRVFGTATGGFAARHRLIAIAGYFLAPSILHLLGTPGDAAPLALAYLRVIFLAIPALLLLTLLMMALRGAGDSLTPLWFMIVAVVLDSGLNPFFIRGSGPSPRMGIAGSAMSTLVGNYVSLIGLFIYIYAKDLPLRLRGARASLLAAQPGDPEDDARQRSADGHPDDRHLDVRAGAGRNGQPRRRRHHGSVRRRDAAVDLCPDAGDGARRRGQRDGVPEYRRRQMGPRRPDHAGRDRPVAADHRRLDRPPDARRPHGARLFMGPDSPALPIARHIHLLATWNFLLFGVMMVLFATVRANGAVWAPLIILAIGLVPVRFGYIFGDLSLARRRRDLDQLPGNAR